MEVGKREKGKKKKARAHPSPTTNITTITPTATSGKQKKNGKRREKKKKKGGKKTNTSLTWNGAFTTYNYIFSGSWQLLFQPEGGEGEKGERGKKKKKKKKGRKTIPHLSTAPQHHNYDQDDSSQNMVPEKEGEGEKRSVPFRISELIL